MIVAFTSLVLGLMAFCTGCTQPRDKARKTLKKKISSCQTSEVKGAFHQVELMGGERKRVLQAACHKKLGRLEKIDEFTFEGETGPYTWRMGLQTDLGVWKLVDVGWPLLEKVARRRDNENLTEETHRKIEGLLEKAQKALPESSWIRLERLENLLALRAMQRSYDEKHPSELGKKASKYFADVVAWSDEQGDNYAEMKARYMVVDHWLEFIRELESAVQSSGRSDQWLEKSIEIAKKKGNPKKAEEYRKQLESKKSERKKLKESAKGFKKSAKNKACEQLKHLSSGTVKRDALKQRIASAIGRIDCEQ